MLHRNRLIHVNYNMPKGCPALHGTALSIQGFYGRKLCFYILENLSVSVADIECAGYTVYLKHTEG